MMTNIVVSILNLSDVIILSRFNVRPWAELELPPEPTICRVCICPELELELELPPEPICICPELELVFEFILVTSRIYSREPKISIWIYVVHVPDLFQNT